jgi:tRNA threonylcarbamoyladenosine biosynthesis protein TsaE
LGAGKTTFVQGIALGLCINESVQSPTFNYLNIYQGTFPLYHFDLYRMKGPSDFFSMGFEEYFDSNGITVIEWAERLAETLPPRAISIHFSHDGNERVAIASANHMSSLFESN